jgi:ribosomal protein S27E
MSSAHQAAAIASAKKRMERTCPQCQAVQVVATSKKNEAVQCHSCGTSIPPKAKES